MKRIHIEFFEPLHTGNFIQVWDGDLLSKGPVIVSDLPYKEGLYKVVLLVGTKSKLQYFFEVRNYTIYKCSVDGYMGNYDYYNISITDV